MGVSETPHVDRIRGYDYVNSVWRAVSVDESGQLGIYTTVNVDVVDAHISSGLVAILSGEIHIMSGAVQVLSGNMDIQILSGQIDAQILSGEIHIMSGSVSVESGVWIAGLSFSGLDIQVDISGDAVTVSGNMVSVASGEIHLLSGLVAVESGEIHIMSGNVHVLSGNMDIQILSGNIYVMSGNVHVLSGNVDTQILSGNIYIMSGNVHILSGHVAATISGTIAVSGHVFVSGTVVAEASGEHVLVVGADYVMQSGAEGWSGEIYNVLEPVTAVQVESFIGKSGPAPAMTVPFEAFVPETRLFTGSDDKHIRFEDTFDGNALDVGKWNLSAGAVTVVQQMAQLQAAGGESVIRSHNRYLYGVLSCKVYIQDTTDANCRFGFTGDYTASTRDSEVEWVGAAGGGRFHTEDTPQAFGGDSYTDVTLENDTWYNVQFVWTPEYAQIWVDGILRASHVTHVSQAPAYLYFRAANGKYLYLGNVSLTAYGDIPITKQGRVPVREQGGVLRAFRPLIATHQSGGEAVGSGEIDRLILKVPYNLCSGTLFGKAAENSGYLYGVWIGGTSGNRPYTGSGCVGSGFGMFLEPGDQKELYVRDLGEVWVVPETSGYPIMVLGETMGRIPGRDVIY